MNAIRVGACHLLLPFVAAALPFLGFEDDALSPAWQVRAGDHVEISTQRFKSGAHSLCWSWATPGSWLQYRSPESFADLVAGQPDTRGSTLGFWLHNDHPTQGILICEWLHGETVVLRAWFHLNFRGWRPLGARLLDLGWQPGQTIDAVRFHAPADIAAGRFYLDYMSVNLLSQGPIPDNQQPWAGHPERLGTLEPTPANPENPAVARPWLPERVLADSLSRDKAAALEQLRSRYVGRLPVPSGTLSAEELPRLRQHAAKLGIRRQDGIVTGRPIDQGGFLRPPDALPFFEYQDLLGKLTKAFAATADADERTALRELLADLTDHLLDQGWAPGANNMGWLGNGYRVRHWPPMVMALRNEFEAMGRLDAMLRCVIWFMGGQEVVEEEPGASLDLLYNYTRHLPAAALMLSNPAETCQWLDALQRYLNGVLTDEGLFGRDGTAFHHNMDHFAYASYEVPGIVDRLVLPLSDTPFRLSDAVHSRLKQFVLAHAFAANPFTIPPNLNGRAGTPMHFDARRLAAMLAPLTAPPGKPVDPALAGLYLHLDQLDPHDSDETAAEYRRLGIQPLPLSGHWALNGTCAALHRRDGWLSVVDGMNRFRRGIEIYGWLESNNYARYACNGSLFLLDAKTPSDHRAGGYQFEGWDWRLWPGTTALLRPPQELFEGYRMFGNASAFAGGTQLGDDGIWGMDLLNNDLRCRKSAFCFDNRITLLTSDISSNQPNETVTTLYQQAVGDRQVPTWVNGEAIDGFPDQRIIACDTPIWLVDSRANGYYLHAGEAPLHVERRPQTWTYLFRRYLKDGHDNPIIDTRRKRFREQPLAANTRFFRPTKGDFVIAYLAHGQRPVVGSAAFTVVVNSSAENMAGFAESMRFAGEAPYHILQHDSRAHILHDRESHTIGYVLFEANEALDHAALLLSNSHPCLLMIRSDDRDLQLSIVSPDLDREVPVRLRLRDRWQLLQELPGVAESTVAGDITELSVSPAGYMPLLLRLRRKAAVPGLALARSVIGGRRDVEAWDDAVATAYHEPVDIDVLANDFAPIGVTLSQVGNATYGTVEAVDGRIRYSPESRFVGRDHFTYRITHGDDESEAEVTVTVRSPNWLEYAYYEGNWGELADTSALEPVSTGTVRGFDLSLAESPRDFAVEFAGYLAIDTPGAYRFYLRSNGISRLWVGGRLVVEHRGRAGTEDENIGAMDLAAGRQPLRLVYLEQGRTPWLEVSYEGPGIPKQPIPEDVLLQEPLGEEPPK